ncbi:MAG: sulfate adenylyltransferase subunit CysN [Hyphomicrobiales bacterium]|nr:sulfate adenylyltransferase subunit CysN [Hyphomicrobiales bacterium]
MEFRSPLYSEDLYEGYARSSDEDLIRREAQQAAEGLLRFLTCGSVDDGKSTLIGRLLYDSQLIYDDQLETLKKDSTKFGTTGDDMDLALLVDGLEDERQQGITIDVAYRFFRTKKRAFIVADTPGHEQYTRNMATGASTSELAIILVDARKGVLNQTKRHATICSLLGIKHIVLAVNKIDLVDYSKDVFDRIVGDFSTFAAKLDFHGVVPVPMSARFGDNVSTPSGNMSWYDGPALMDYLETVRIEEEADHRAFRFPVQYVARPDLDFRGYAGTVASGRIAVGDRVTVAASGQSSEIKRIVTADGDLEVAGPEQAVMLTLTDEIDISRGDVLSTASERPVVADQFQAELICLTDEPMFAGRQYTMRIGMQMLPATLTTIKYQLNVERLDHLATKQIELNEIGVCTLATAKPVAFDPYDENPATGSFILIDRFTNATVAAGMIEHPLRRATNIHRQSHMVSAGERAALKGQKPAIVWFTGLSGSGKSTIANIVERRLFEAGRHSFLLDGDNMRHGLNQDLGFTEADRIENIRRVGEVAKLFTDAGVLTLCCFISPFKEEREMIREKVGEGGFIEVFIDTPLEECIKRDPKGLYKKAIAGDIKNFTGIDSPYERPEAPELHLETDGEDADTLADRVIDELIARGLLSI